MLTTAVLSGLPLDDAFLNEAGVKGYNPNLKCPTHTKLLFTLGSMLCVGITIAQYGRILKRCTQCLHYIFSEWMRMHSCHGTVIEVDSEDFSLTKELLKVGCRSLTITDVKNIFVVCDTCRRMYMERFDRHICPLGAHDDEDTLID